jgi:hypothetical protein
MGCFFLVAWLLPSTALGQHFGCAQAVGLVKCNLSGVEGGLVKCNLSEVEGGLVKCNLSEVEGGCAFV